MIVLAGRSLPLSDPLCRCAGCGEHMLWWGRRAWHCSARRVARDVDGARLVTLAPGCRYGVGLGYLLRGVVIGVERAADGTDRRVIIDPFSDSWLDAGVPIGRLLLQTRALEDAEAGVITLSWIPRADLPRLRAEAEWLDRQSDAAAAFLVDRESA